MAVLVLGFGASARRGFRIPFRGLIRVSEVGAEWTLRVWSLNAHPVSEERFRQCTLVAMEVPKSHPAL